MSGLDLDKASRRLRRGLAVYVGIVVVFLILPLIVAVMLAFSSGEGIGFPPPGFSLKWFERVFASAPFRQGLVTSLVIALSAAGISAVAGTEASIAINHFRFRGRGLARMLILAPLSLPGIVIGIAILFVLPLLGLSIGRVATIAGHAVIGTPYVAYMVLAALANYDLTLEQASANLGANRRQTFLRVTLPLIQPAITAGTVCAALTSFDNIALSLFLSRGDTLPLRLMQHIQFYADPSVAAASVILVLISMASLPLLGRAFGAAPGERK